MCFLLLYIHAFCVYLPRLFETGKTFFFIIDIKKMTQATNKFIFSLQLNCRVLEEFCVCVLRWHFQCRRRAHAYMRWKIKHTKNESMHME